MRKVFEDKKKMKQNKIPQTYGNFLFPFWCNILIVRHVSEIKKNKKLNFYSNVFAIAWYFQEFWNIENTLFSWFCKKKNELKLLISSWDFS